MSHPKTFFTAASVSITALLLTGCGTTEDDEQPGAAESPQPTQTETETETAEPSPTPETTPADEDDADGQDSNGQETDEGSIDEGSDDEGSGDETDAAQEPDVDDQDEDDSAAEPDAAEEPDLTGFSRESQASEDFPHPGEPGEEAIQLVDVRVGQHEGYDRVVFDHRGDGQISYQVEYIEQPTSHRSGDPIEVPGDAFLEVAVFGLTFDSGNHDHDDILTGSIEGAEAGSMMVQGIHAQSIFEGGSGYFIGLDQERDFSVEIREDPVRVIVDIAH